MRDFIQRLKAKPEHIRRRIAVGTSVGITGVVTTAWFFTLLFSGNLSLAISPTIIGANGQVAQADANGNIISGGAGETGSVGGSNASGNTGDASNIAGVDAAHIFTAEPATPQSNLSKLLAAVGISIDPPPAPALKVEDQAPTTTAPAEPTSISF